MSWCAYGFVGASNPATGSEWWMNSMGNDVIVKCEARLSKKLGFKLMF